VGFTRVAQGGRRGVLTTGLNALAAEGVKGWEARLTWSSSIKSLLLNDYKSIGFIKLLTPVQL